MLTSSIKREIRKLYVAVVQLRQRNLCYTPPSLLPKLPIVSSQYLCLTHWFKTDVPLSETSISLSFLSLFCSLIWFLGVILTLVMPFPVIFCGHPRFTVPNIIASVCNKMIKTYKADPAAAKMPLLVSENEI